MSGTPRCAQSSMKCVPLTARLGEQDAVVGDEADGIAADMREAGYEGGAIALLEFIEAAAIDEAGDDFADIVGLARVGGNDAVEFGGIVEGIFRRRLRDQAARAG